MTDQLRTVIVDDEAAARALLREYLAGLPEVEVVAECADGFAAVKAIREVRPDLVLLDVQMPRLSGIEVLELIAEPAAPGGGEPDDSGARPAVIFVTAYDQYAVKAFEVEAADYLLKPFGPERLGEAVARAAARLRRGELAGWQEIARSRARAGQPLERIVVQSGTRIDVVPVDRLDYVEARDDQVRLKAGAAEHRKAQTLSELEGLLDPRRFVRIHRSYLLNLDRLARLDLYAKDSHVAILADGTRLPVSRAGYARLKRLL